MLNEDEEKGIFENMAKSESSQEESEGKNIFKTKRDFSDEDESDEEDRGHKRRKTSNQNSIEREIGFYILIVFINRI